MIDGLHTTNWMSSVRRRSVKG